MSRAPRLAELLPGTCLLAGACVTVIDEAPLVGDQLDPPEFAVAQTIPLGRAPTTPNEHALAQLYDGVLRRMQEAVDDRDVRALFGLLDAYEKPGLPDWLAERLAGYRALGHGLRFVEHAAANATLRLVGDGTEPGSIPPPIGAPLVLEFALPAGPRPVRLGGRDDDDPVRFAFSIQYEDTFVDGNTVSHRRQPIEPLAEAVELAGDTVLRLPLEFDVGAGDAVRRQFHLRVDLLGGYVREGSVRAPVPRRTLAALSLTQWPRGYEPIAEKPLLTLREALRLGDPKHFPHVFLGALFTAGAEREQALELLVDQVRFAPQPLATVAMATLHELSGAEAPVGDREAWLAWWNTRR